MRTNLWLAALAATVLGCSARSAENVCAPGDWCGQPCIGGICGGTVGGMVVEVLAPSATAPETQEFEVESDSQTPNFDLSPSSTIRVRLTEVNGAAHTSPVRVQLAVQSQRLFGMIRRSDVTLVPSRGVVNLPSAPGPFTLTITPRGLGYPPLRATGIAAGQSSEVLMHIPALTSLNVVRGRFLESLGDPAALANTQVDLQVVNAGDDTPLSARRTYTADDIAQTQGAFELPLSPESEAASEPILKVTMTTAAGTLDVQRTLSRDNLLGTSPLDIAPTELMGTASISGQFNDVRGRPTGGATAYLETRFPSGGKMTTRAVTTNTDGRFTLAPVPANGESTLWVLSEARSPCGVLRFPVADPLPSEVSVRCPAKARIQGSVTREDGRSAGGIRVTGTLVSNTQEYPGASSAVKTETDSEGRFAFDVSPGVYRFDFAGTVTEGRTSRFLTVSPAVSDADNVPINLPRLVMPEPRSSSGVVTQALPPGGSQQPLAFGSLRFYMLSLHDSRVFPFIVGETQTNASGYYSLALPASQ